MDDLKSSRLKRVVLINMVFIRNQAPSQIEATPCFLEGYKLQGSHTDWKTWKNRKTFSSQGKVREFCADWKSQGNLDKILEKSGKFREFLFFVLF